MVRRALSASCTRNWILYFLPYRTTHPIHVPLPVFDPLGHHVTVVLVTVVVLLSNYLHLSYFLSYMESARAYYRFSWTLKSASGKRVFCLFLPAPYLRQVCRSDLSFPPGLSCPSPSILCHFEYVSSFSCASFTPSVRLCWNMNHDLRNF